MSSASTPYSTRPLRLAGEHAGLVELWCAGLGMSLQAARAKLEIAYLANPAGIGEALGLESGADPLPVGAQCLHLRRFSFQGEPIPAACLSDFVVTQAHRSAGPAVMLMRAAATRAGDLATLVYGFPNAKAAAVCARAGLRRAGELQRMGKLLRLRALQRDAKQSLPMRLAAPIVDGALAVADIALQWLHGLGRARCEHAPLDDPRLDMLWERRVPSLCLSERSSTMVAWRYRYDREDGDWQLLLVTRGRGEPWGYVVWRLREGIVVIGDTFCADPGRHLSGVVLAAARHFRGRGALALSMELMAPADVHRQLRLALFAPHGQGQAVFLRDIGPAGALRDALFLSGFDRDI